MRHLHTASFGAERWGGRWRNSTRKNTETQNEQKIMTIINFTFFTFCLSLSLSNAFHGQRHDTCLNGIECFSNERYVSLSLFEWHSMRWVCVCFFSMGELQHDNVQEARAFILKMFEHIRGGNMIHSWAIESKWASKWVHSSALSPNIRTIFYPRRSFMLQPLPFIAHLIQCFTSFIRASLFLLLSFILWSFFLLQLAIKFASCGTINARRHRHHEKPTRETTRRERKKARSFSPALDWKFVENQKMAFHMWIYRIYVFIIIIPCIHRYEIVIRTGKIDEILKWRAQVYGGIRWIASDDVICLFSGYMQ